MSRYIERTGVSLQLKVPGYVILSRAAAVELHAELVAALWSLDALRPRIAKMQGTSEAPIHECLRRDIVELLAEVDRAAIDTCLDLSSRKLTIVLDGLDPKWCVRLMCDPEAPRPNEALPFISGIEECSDKAVPAEPVFGGACPHGYTSADVEGCPECRRPDSARPDDAEKWTGDYLSRFTDASGPEAGLVQSWMVDAYRAGAASRPDSPGSMASPWPARDVVNKLCEATSILLIDKDYDGHGWEAIDAALKVAQAWLREPPRAETVLHSAPATDFWVVRRSRPNSSDPTPYFCGITGQPLEPVWGPIAVAIRFPDQLDASVASRALEGKWNCVAERELQRGGKHG